jgi:tetratricopeptide (TPR) repeat protein
LLQIPQDNPNYSAARLELCRLAHEQWSAAETANPEASMSREELAGITVSAALDVVTLASDGPLPASPSQRVGVCLLAADVLIHKLPPDVAAADDWLKRAIEIATPDLMDDELRADWSYLELLLGQMAKNPLREENAARWLAARGSRPEHLRAAWIALGELAEQRLEEKNESLTAEERNRRLGDAIRFYERAVAVDAGTSGPSIASLSATARLAPLQLQLGQTAAACTSYETLVRFDDRKIPWLQGLARSATELGKWGEAAETWRRIAVAVPAGNNEWLESRHGLIRCLLELDPAAARQVWQQTTLLAPEMPELWAGRFARLVARMETLDEGGRDNR